MLRYMWATLRVLFPTCLRRCACCGFYCALVLRLELMEFETASRYRCLLYIHVWKPHAIYCATVAFFFVVSESHFFCTIAPCMECGGVSAVLCLFFFLHTPWVESAPKFLAVPVLFRMLHWHSTKIATGNICHQKRRLLKSNARGRQ